MTNTNPRRLALNLPLLGLWIAAAGVAGLGYWMLQRGTAGQAEFYTAGGTDPAELLSQQSLTTTGGLLLVAGVLGLLLALAAHARARSAAILAERTATDAATLAPVASDDLDDDLDDEQDDLDLEAGRRRGDRRRRSRAGDDRPARRRRHREVPSAESAARPRLTQRRPLRGACAPRP